MGGWYAVREQICPLDPVGWPDLFQCSGVLNTYLGDQFSRVPDRLLDSIIDDALATLVLETYAFRREDLAFIDLAYGPLTDLALQDDTEDWLRRPPPEPRTSSAAPSATSSIPSRQAPANGRSSRTYMGPQSAGDLAAPGQQRHGGVVAVQRSASSTWARISAWIGSSAAAQAPT